MDTITWRVTAIDVKSGVTTGSLAGLGAFKSAFGPRVATELVGAGGIPIDEFLSR